MASHERRIVRAERFDLHILARLTVFKGSVEETCLCNIVNMSVTGALVECSALLPIGQLLKYTFSIPGTETVVNLTGEVAREEIVELGLPGDPAGLESGNAIKSPVAAGQKRGRLNRYAIRFLQVMENDKSVIEGLFFGKKKRR